MLIKKKWIKITTGIKCKEISSIVLLFGIAWLHPVSRTIHPKKEEYIIVEENQSDFNENEKYKTPNHCTIMMVNVTTSSSSIDGSQKWQKMNERICLKGRTGWLS